MKVMTYNIHHGEGTDGVIDLPRIAGVIRAVNPQIVLLQDVDRGTRRAGEVDQAEELAKLLGWHHVFGEAMPLEGGSYGEAVPQRSRTTLRP